MNNPLDPHTDEARETVAGRLEEIARAPLSPPARLPDRHPENIPATTSDSNATASFVLGIISLCLPVISFPIALLGVILGLIANAHGHETARAGITLNLIALGISVIGGISFLISLILWHLPHG